MEVGVEAAEGLAGEDVQPDGYQGSGRRVEQAVRGGGADQLVAEVAPGPVDRGDLEVLAEGVGDLPVPGLHLAAQRRHVDRGRAVLTLVHAADEFLDGGGDHEVRAVPLEGFDGPGRAGQCPAEDLADRTPRQVGVLLGAGECELLLDDLLGEHEPSVLVPGAHDVVEGAEGVEAGEQRDGEPGSGGVEPERGRAGQDADAVPGPDRVPVLDALGVVPHPVAVDESGSGGGGDVQHQAVDVRGDAGEHPGGRGAEPFGPGGADLLVVAADAAGGDDHGLGAEFEVPGDLAGAGLAARHGGRREDLAGDGVDRTAARGQPGDAVSEAEGDPADPDGVADPAGEGFDQAGPGAPGDVEARDGVAGPGGEQSAAFGPADHGEQPDAHAAQPGPLLAGREVDVRLGPAARPRVLVAVEAGGAEPVLPGEFAGVADPHPALLGRVDQEEPAEGPVRLAAERPGGFLVEQDDAPSGVGEFGGGGQAREAGSDHDDVGVEGHQGSFRGRRFEPRSCGQRATGSTHR